MQLGSAQSLREKIKDSDNIDASVKEVRKVLKENFKFRFIKAKKLHP